MNTSSWIRRNTRCALALGRMVGYAYAYAQDTRSILAGKKPNIALTLSHNLRYDTADARPY